MTLIDISNLDIKNIDMMKDVISECKDPVLLYMPNLSYQTEDFEALIAELGIRSYCVPITLPMLDIVNQMKYAGINVTPEIVMKIQKGIRKVILDTMEEEANNHVKC